MAFCTGCKRNSAAIEEYDDDDNPVEDDGTYSDGKFVCTDCYFVLIRAGIDIGPPKVLQDRARELGLKNTAN